MAVIHQVSLLNSKAIKKINPKNIGWVRPDGIINFATKDAAKNYAIKRCIAANKLKDKFERGVVVKDNMVLQEVDGKLLSVRMNHKKLSEYRDCDLYHNHPTPGTLSAPDFGLLKTKKYMKTVIAIDILGRCYSMTKLPLKKIKYLPRTLSDFVTNILQAVKGVVKVEIVKSKYTPEIKKLGNEVVKQQKQLSEEELKKSPVYKAFLEKVLKMASEVHEMWKENAESLGIKYEYKKLW